MQQGPVLMFPFCTIFPFGMMTVLIKGCCCCASVVHRHSENLSPVHFHILGVLVVIDSEDQLRSRLSASDRTIVDP